MISSILSAIGSAASAVSAFFGYKSSANKQRRDAEKDVADKAAQKADRKAEIREAVYTNDDAKVNALASGILAPVLCCAACGAVLLGCVSSPTPVYIPTDRRIETVTNSLGIVCKAVPNAVFCELLERSQELADLKAEMAVDKRLSK